MELIVSKYAPVYGIPRVRGIELLTKIGQQLKSIETSDANDEVETNAAMRNIVIGMQDDLFPHERDFAFFLIGYVTAFTTFQMESQ